MLVSGFAIEGSCNGASLHCHQYIKERDLSTGNLESEFNALMERIDMSFEAFEGIFAVGPNEKNVINVAIIV